MHAELCGDDDIVSVKECRSYLEILVVDPLYDTYE